jgi:hypothetical protein
MRSDQWFMSFRILRSHQQPAVQRAQSEPFGAISHGGAYVITGGLGSLGVLVASWLGQQQPAGSNTVHHNILP